MATERVQIERVVLPQGRDFKTAYRELVEILKLRLIDGWLLTGLDEGEGKLFFVRRQEGK